MKESKKLFITILLAAGLLTAVAATENAGRAVLGISPHEKEITVTAVTADGSPVQVEGCTVTEFPSGEETVLTATGTKVVLKGVLIELVCYANKLTALDVRGLTALQELYCQNNMLTLLDVRELTGLHMLYCGNNRLTALDIRGLTALQKLYCNGNEIASLDVRGLTALQELVCYKNRLTSLDVQGLTALQWLVCHFNKLTSLDVQGLPALQVLDCSSNRLTALNVQGLPALEALGFQDNRLEEKALIRILNSLPDRKTDEEGLAVLYSEGEKLPKESGSAVPASAEFRAAFKAAKQKNWKLYMQTEDENGTEIRLQEE